MTYKLLIEAGKIILQQLDRVGNILQTLEYSPETAAKVEQEKLQETMIDDLLTLAA